MTTNHTMNRLKHCPKCGETLAVVGQRSNPVPTFRCLPCGMTLAIQDQVCQVRPDDGSAPYGILTFRLLEIARRRGEGRRAVLAVREAARYRCPRCRELLALAMTTVDHWCFACELPATVEGETLTYAFDGRLHRAPAPALLDVAPFQA